MNEQLEWVWVDFVGGPLDGQSRRLERDRTHLTVPEPLKPIAECFSEAFETLPDSVVRNHTYKIERVCVGRPGTVGYRETFKGVLV